MNQKDLYINIFINDDENDLNFLTIIKMKLVWNN